MKLDNVKLQEIRLKCGMSQSDLAKASGVSLQTIHRIENRKTKKPSQETIQAIAKALLVDVSEIDYN